MKDILPPRALPLRQHLWQRTRFLFTRWVRGESGPLASGLEDSSKTPPGYDRITIFAQAAQATDIEQAKLRHLPLQE